MIKNKKTTQTKRIVTKDKKERFKEIVADNKEFSSFVGNFAKLNVDNNIDNKKDASKDKNKDFKDNN
jgi:hypothetical protein